MLIWPNFGYFSMNEERKFFSILDQHCSRLSPMLNNTIAHYQITAKLDREIAIKVLPESLAQNQERLALFERETQTLDSLNHSNIAVISNLEQTKTNSKGNERAAITVWSHGKRDVRKARKLSYSIRNKITFLFAIKCERHLKLLLKTQIPPILPHKNDSLSFSKQEACRAV